MITKPEDIVKMSVGLLQVSSQAAGMANSHRERRQSGVDMDTERREGIAYEYLCHLEEAKKWMEECIKEEMPQSTDLEENLRNGVYFAKLGHFCAPNVVPNRKIFDADQSKWGSRGLHFKHTDNINFYLTALREIGLPEVRILIFIQHYLIPLFRFFCLRQRTFMTKRTCLKPSSVFTHCPCTCSKWAQPHRLRYGE